MLMSEGCVSNRDEFTLTSDRSELVSFIKASLRARPRIKITATPVIFTARGEVMLMSKGSVSNRDEFTLTSDRSVVVEYLYETYGARQEVGGFLHK